jgi:hypothetical protein
MSHDRDVVPRAPRHPRPGLFAGAPWRPVAGVLVAVLGYLVVAFPAAVVYESGVEWPGCDMSPSEADFACFGEPRPAAEWFAWFTALVAAPAVLGVLVAWPRRRGLVLLVLACAALGLYSYLVLANPTG